MKWELNEICIKHFAEYLELSTQSKQLFLFVLFNVKGRTVGNGTKIVKLIDSFRLMNV